MVGRGVDTTLLYSKEGVNRIFGDTLPILRSHWLTMGNLEGSVTYTKTKVKKSFNFKFSPKVLTPLKSAGFDYFSLTNNHIYDYGEKGLLDTINNLQKYNIATSGIGKTPKEAITPWEKVIDKTSGDRVKVLSLGAYPQEANGFSGSRQAAVTPNRPGILWNTVQVVDDIKNQFGDQSFNILMVHGGYEWKNRPHEYQIKLYKKLIDNGADVIFGSHPHVLQGVEAYKKGLIVYSMGNFIFPGMELTEYGEESMIFSLGIIENSIKYVEFIPVKINKKVISIDKSGKILNRFLKLTKDINSYTTLQQ